VKANHCKLLYSVYLTLNSARPTRLAVAASHAIKHPCYNQPSEPNLNAQLLKNHVYRLGFVRPSFLSGVTHGWASTSQNRTSPCRPSHRRPQRICMSCWTVSADVPAWGVSLNICRVPFWDRQTGAVSSPASLNICIQGQTDRWTETEPMLYHFPLDATNIITWVGFYRSDVLPITKSRLSNVEGN